MNPQTKTNAKDFILNLGAIVALYTLIFSLVNLLFTVIDSAFPPVTSGFFSSSSISWPVATLIIFFPIFILLMWLLEKEYKMEPEKQNQGIHKWLTYITLFIAGLTVAIDLITALYKFLNGDNLTTGFLLKVFVLLIIAVCVFIYYITDVRGRLTSKFRIIWRIIAGVIVIGSIIWGFAVLGSPATQRLIKYDEQKVNDLMGINNGISNYYQNLGILPKTLADLSPNYYVPAVDLQTQKPYEYEKTGNLTYNLCAEFNKASNSNGNTTAFVTYPYGTVSWNHPAGRYCFGQTINPNNYYKGAIPPVPTQ